MQVSNVFIFRNPKTLIIRIVVDLFRWMLQTDPAVRFSAAQAMRHPFLMEYIPSGIRS